VLIHSGAALLIALGLSVPLAAESIEGTVIIKKRLTKPRVTASLPLYARGTPVELDSDAQTDPLVYERSRVAVYVEGSFPASPATPLAKMEQTGRRFSPELLVVEAGSRVSFPNGDPIFHNVFSLSKPKTFDLGNYPKGDTRVVTFSQPGIVYVNCHLHSNMTGTIVVAPNRWHTGVDRTGAFVLDNMPPGAYTLVAWHKAAGFFHQQVRIVPGQVARVEFLIPVDENGRRLDQSSPGPATLKSTLR
jgi:plastocyanin